MNKHKPHSGIESTLSLSLSRKRKLALRRIRYISVLAMIVALITPMVVGSVQNIFVGFRKVTDIWYNGQKIEKVIYNGQTIWERIHNMQDFTTEQCANLTAGKTVQLKDTRDNKVYRVRKMADSRCWMVDNLAYNIGSSTGRPTYNPTAQLVSAPATSVSTRAQYAQNTTAYNMPNNGKPTPSYLYNWCAAMADTSANCATTLAYTAGQPATPQTGICPAPFRLPIGGAEPTTAGNGSNQSIAAATTTSEFSKLDIWLGGTGTNRSSANTFTNFTSDNTTNSQLFWLGVFSGRYYSGLYLQGNYGYWWSSTANSDALAYYMYLVGDDTNISPANSNNKLFGFAVRCVL